MVSMSTVFSSSSISLSRSSTLSSSTFASCRSKACCTLSSEASALASASCDLGRRGRRAARGWCSPATMRARRVQIVGEEAARGVELARLGRQLGEDLVGRATEAHDALAHLGLGDVVGVARGWRRPGHARPRMTSAAASSMVRGSCGRCIDSRQRRRLRRRRQRAARHVAEHDGAEHGAHVQRLQHGDRRDEQLEDDRRSAAPACRCEAIVSSSGMR